MAGGAASRAAETERALLWCYVADGQVSFICAEQQTQQLLLLLNAELASPAWRGALHVHTHSLLFLSYFFPTCFKERQHKRQPTAFKRRQFFFLIKKGCTLKKHLKLIIASADDVTGSSRLHQQGGKTQ